MALLRKNVQSSSSEHPPSLFRCPSLSQQAFRNHPYSNLLDQPRESLCHFQAPSHGTHRVYRRSTRLSVQFHVLFQCWAISHLRSSDDKQGNIRARPSIQGRNVDIPTRSPLSVITSTITGRRQVTVHFKTHGLRRSVCIVLLCRDHGQLPVSYRLRVV